MGVCEQIDRAGGEPISDAAAVVELAMARRRATAYCMNLRRLAIFAVATAQLCHRQAFPALANLHLVQPISRSPLRIL